MPPEIRRFGWVVTPISPRPNRRGVIGAWLEVNVQPLLGGAYRTYIARSTYESAVVADSLPPVQSERRYVFLQQFVLYGHGGW